MANVNTLVSLHIVDGLGVKSTMPLWIVGPDTQTLAQLATAAGMLASDTDNIIGGQIYKITAALDCAIPGDLKATPQSDSRVEETGLFNFSQGVVPYKYGIDVPSILDSVLTGGRIDLANTDVAAWVTLITTAIGAFSPESTAFHALLALTDALLTFRKHRKQLDRVSKETP